MDQRIGFCTTSDGVRIAYAVVGADGPPVVYAAGFPTHLEVEWERPGSRDFLEALSDGSTFVRYDMRGCGLSDSDVHDFSLDALVRDYGAWTYGILFTIIFCETFAPFASSRAK